MISFVFSSWIISQNSYKKIQNICMQTYDNLCHSFYHLTDSTWLWFWPLLSRWLFRQPLDTSTWSMSSWPYSYTWKIHQHELWLGCKKWRRGNPSVYIMSIWAEGMFANVANPWCWSRDCGRFWRYTATYGLSRRQLWLCCSPAQLW